VRDRAPILRLQGHLASVGEERCAYVRPMVFANRAMATRATLEREARNWLDAAGTLPPGNGADGQTAPLRGVAFDDARREHRGIAALAANIATDRRTDRRGWAVRP
jgi:hypothetical protein